MLFRKRVMIRVCSGVGDVRFDHFVVWLPIQFPQDGVTVLYFVMTLERGAFD